MASGSKIIGVSALSEEQYRHETLVQQASIIGTASEFELRMCAPGGVVCRDDMREIARLELARRARLSA